MQYFQRSIGDDEVDFLPTDKCESFLQVNSITMGVQSQGCPKYPKQQAYNTFAISQGKREGWRWFSLAADKRQIDTIILGVCGQAWPNYLK